MLLCLIADLANYYFIERIDKSWLILLTGIVCAIGMYQNVEKRGRIGEIILPVILFFILFMLFLAFRDFSFEEIIRESRRKSGNNIGKPHYTEKIRPLCNAGSIGGWVKENRQQQPARCKHRDGQHQADHAKRFQRITQALAHAVYIVFSHILSRVNGAIFLPMQRSCCAPFLTPQPCRTA